MAKDKLGFPRTRRLAGRKAFARVFGRRCSASNRHLVVYALPNGLAYARLGLSVGRKYGPAVRRNRAKRLLREAFRLEVARRSHGFDLVCIPRGDGEPTLTEVRASMRSVAARAIKRARDAADDERLHRSDTAPI